MYSKVNWTVHCRSLVAGGRSAGRSTGRDGCVLPICTRCVRYVRAVPCSTHRAVRHRTAVTADAAADDDDCHNGATVITSSAVSRTALPLPSCRVNEPTKRPAVLITYAHIHTPFQYTVHPHGDPHSAHNSVVLPASLFRTRSKRKLKITLKTRLSLEDKTL